MQVDISWAECNSLFTALFECMVIECLKEANFSAVARRMKLSWNEVDGIINAIVLKATNALGKSMKATIQKIKAQAFGYRNR
jgi:transposase